MRPAGWVVPLSRVRARATFCTVSDPSVNAKPRNGGQAASTPVRVLTVDDQPIFLRALRQLIGAAPGFALVGEAHSGTEALERAAELHPDLVLVDVRMPGMDGVETARRLLACDTGTTVVLFSLEPLLDPQAVLELGVTAFVRKQDLSVATLQSVWSKRRLHAGSERPT
jgi:DNA-binding NarL/FixJ family response regulator